MVLTVHERIDQAHDRYQHHCQEQGIHPSVVLRVARCGLGRHGLQRLKERMPRDGSRRPEEILARFALNTGSLPASLTPHNATSVTQGMITCRDNPAPRGGHAPGRTWPIKLVRRQWMMQNRASRFRVGAIADLWVVCNWEGLDCFSGKLGLAEPSVLSKRAAVRRFSILASWQGCVRQGDNFGLQVRPILCAGPAENSPSGHSVGFGGRSWCAS